MIASRDPPAVAGFFPIGLKIPLVAVFLATAVPVFIVVLRAKDHLCADRERR